MTALLVAAMISGPPLVEVDATRYVSTVVHRIDHRARVIAPHRSRLLRIAQCESGGRWHIATGNGFYGGLQFTARSWWAVGGTRLPHLHPRREQLYRAVRLMRLQGWGAWPVCQYR